MQNLDYKTLAKLDIPLCIPSLKMKITKRRKKNQGKISKLKPDQNCGILFICRQKFVVQKYLQA